MNPAPNEEGLHSVPNAINRAVYREIRWEGLKKALTPRGYAQFMRVFAGFFLPKLTGKEFQKNRENRAK